jgi:hypothetical protein
MQCAYRSVQQLWGWCMWEQVLPQQRVAPTLAVMPCMLLTSLTSEPHLGGWSVGVESTAGATK